MGGITIFALAKMTTFSFESGYSILKMPLIITNYKSQIQSFEKLQSISNNTSSKQYLIIKSNNKKKNVNHIQIFIKKYKDYIAIKKIYDTIKL